MGTQLLLEVVAYSVALWLGLYLIGRNVRDGRLLLAGLGLVSYALGLALDILAMYGVAAYRATLLAWQRPLLLLPALFWSGLLVILFRGQEPWRERWRRHPRPMVVIVAAAIFFVLGLTFVFFPLNFLPRVVMLLGIGGDLLCLGISVAVLDAFDEGEALRPHFLRSSLYALATAVLFGGQVVLAMFWGVGITPALVLLLLTIITAAIVTQTLATPFQRFLDSLAFFNEPEIRQTSDELRAAADMAQRFNNALDVTAVDEKEFARLTRRALSHMGNLPKLATSPLTQMVLIEQRLQQQGATTDTLTRANELKSLLHECIHQLKPRDKAAFGTSNEWRHYNALYYPYVVGLKPYSRRMVHNGDLNPTEKEALDWFRSQVPERTLYNWQNAAARLIAQNLRERTQ